MAVVLTYQCERYKINIKCSN